VDCSAWDIGGATRAQLRLAGEDIGVNDDATLVGVRNGALCLDRTAPCARCGVLIQWFDESFGTSSFSCFHHC